MTLDARIPLQAVARPVNVLAFNEGFDAMQKSKANALAVQDAETGQKMKTAQMLAKGVLGAEDKAGAYALAREQAGRYGMDVSALPEQWGPEADAALRMVVIDEDKRTALMRNLESMGLAPGSEEYRDAAMRALGVVKDPNVPSGFRATPNGMEPIPGGPADPSYKQSISGKKIPAGFREGPNGTLEPIPGGPADPAYRDAARGEGMTVYDPATGKPIMSTGKGGKLPKPTVNEVAKRELDARDTLARLQRIEKNLDEFPEMERIGTLGGQIENWTLGAIDWAGMALSPEDQKRLEAYTTMRGDILENLNFTIKAITGAAMTESEAKRIGATLPSAKDGPVVFKSKLNRSVEAARMAVARYNYWRHRGMDGKPWEVTNLSDMRRVLDDRMKELYDKVDAGEMTREDAARAFAKEFGI